ncbi:pyruvate dehydrogenase E2 component (dihydrolipoamide acetyltransferase) [Paraburkholderia tropica]|uniref:acetoin dehydrogenase dihydrolipoyllysine-residue acetyltransferase subunit n=1 Tax=Paraburkholderia tropica TaxID=92647 RepID=UPI000F52C92F|nr:MULTISPECIES: acetoin dehydrogenase dihydrolipoyllysine-residue acetyltransferase subunit [Paraburkholderia]MBB3002594.1 pyruvate dehydrogenase E2 component (dihydrolipoamide acetyltransferase) [Paraburkholderia tropica]MBB6317725.1 pyruvate dehydrogenase E2 component (dihydrolipoamide acetyltransferase) [Paraburkholderia tropica]RQM48570.1 acetoin dehydrogenase dihydrolipoyllysine-residue acetyltransferase subunit [Paraburkholderia bannensis]
MPIHMITMPKWGLSMEQGQVNGWLKSPGDKVSKGDELLDVESDKIASGVECAFDGILRRQIAQEGDTLPVGALLGVVADQETSDAEIDAAVAEFQRDFVPAKAGDADAGPQPEKAQIGGRTVRWLKLGEGDGTPVVLIHGFGGDLNNWLFNHADLATGRTVWALDLPGHGESGKAVESGALDELAQSVIDFLDTQKIERAHLVGHSLGGAVAMAVAERAPTRVASLSLIASAGLGDEIDGAYIEGFASATNRNVLKPHVTKLFADPALVTRQLVEDLVKYKRLEGVQDALAKIASQSFAGGAQRRVFRDRLSTLAPKVLVIWGDADQIIPARHAQGLAPTVQVEVIAGKGHMVQMEAAAEINRLLKAFFDAGG